MGIHHVQKIGTKWFRRSITIFSILIIASLIISAFITWPKGNTDNFRNKEYFFDDAQYEAKVDFQKVDNCSFGEKSGIKCKFVFFKLTEGPKVDQKTGVPCMNHVNSYCVYQTFDPTYKLSPKFKIGEKVILSYKASAPGKSKYVYVDRQRRPQLLILFAIFVLVVVLFGAWRGLLSILGLAGSLAIILLYILPALLVGTNPLAVSIIGSGLVAAVALYLAHGFKTLTSVSYISTLISLGLATVLAQVFVKISSFSGLTSEESSIVALGKVNLQGLIIAGIVLATVGALDDMTVTQSSAIAEIKSINPKISVSNLWWSGIRIGRDHVASTVNTLALAYVGTGLPLMLLFVLSELPLSAIANSEIIATQIVGALAGSIGLVISVPITTLLAILAVNSSKELVLEDKIIDEVDEEIEPEVDEEKSIEEILRAADEANTKKDKPSDKEQVIEEFIEESKDNRKEEKFLK